MRILYVDTYTTRTSDFTSSSDSIGYGITSSGAIRQELLSRGVSVCDLDLSTPTGCGGTQSPRLHRSRWVASHYPALVESLHASPPPDLIFVFHAFVISPALIRLIECDLGLSAPIVGYIHGSHWDVTDTYRAERYPGLELFDLANLDALDKILVVSKYLENTLKVSIGRLSAALADRLAARVRCVGLPLDTQLIDSFRTDQRSAPPLIVFNHAPIASKHPDLFAEAIAPVLRRTTARVLFTRRFAATAPGAAQLEALCREFGDRIILGQDMSLPDYYRSLWSASIQVSTASHESLGVATLEAMYTGTCCLVPRLGSYPEICGEQFELLYGPGDTTALTKHVLTLLADPQRRVRVGEYLAARANAYSTRRVVDRILDVFAEALA